HPLARALVERAQETGNAIPSAADVRAERGMGVSGTVAGRKVAIGSRRLALDAGIAPDSVEAMTERLGGSGALSFILVDGSLAGAVRFADRPRPEARSVIADLKRRGLPGVM